MATTITDPTRLNLTEAYLRSLSTPAKALYVGDDWNIRFQARTAADAAKDLTGATIKLTVKHPAGTLVTRTTGTAISGAGINEIVIDADQSAETGDTGRGWFQINVASTSGEVTTWSAIEGLCDYAIKILVGGVEDVLARGKLEVIVVPGSYPL